MDATNAPLSCTEAQIYRKARTIHMFYGTKKHGVILQNNVGFLLYQKAVKKAVKLGHTKKWISNSVFKEEQIVIKVHLN